MIIIGRKTILEISNNRRKEIKNLVCQTLVSYGTPVLPIKIGAIIRNISYIKLITYSSQIKKYNISYHELIINAETKDSYAVRQGSSGKYCIYYNDIDKNIVTSNRVRWNLAHELGHVILNHHETVGLEKLYRDGLDDDSYNYLEEEADYFAQLILVPHVVLLGFRVDNAKKLQIMCKISEPASKKRFYEFCDWKTHVDGDDKYDNKIHSFFYEFMYKKKCKNCGAGTVQRHGKYCPACGAKNKLEWGDGNMVYPTMPASEEGKLIECPVCHNTETNIEGNFCQICGALLKNYCTNKTFEYQCPVNVLPTNARYCPTCGEPSTFLNRGFLKPWDFNKNSGYMIIPDGFDEELPFN